MMKPWLVGCLQLSFEEGQTSQGHFTLTLQLKNDREACLYRPGIGQVRIPAQIVLITSLLWELFLHTPCMVGAFCIRTAGLQVLCYVRLQRAWHTSTHANALASSAWHNNCCLWA